MQCLCQSSGVLCDLLFYYFINGRSRVYGDTVSGVDTGSFDMLHDTRDQDIGTVAYSINLNLLTL